MIKKIFYLLGIALCATQAFGSVYYVATNGSDSNKGTKEKPFATLKKANAVVSAGDTVWIRGGVYNLKDTTFCERARMSAGILLDKSGESDKKRIHYFAYPGEQPIFDGTNLLIGQAVDKTTSSTDLEYTAGILIYANYLHLRGLEIRNVPMAHNSNYGIYVTRCKHVVLEQINSHHNMGPGFFVNDGAAGGGGHLFLNCDSHDNYDPYGRQGDGENADGFGVHYQTEGDTTKFYGCRAWWNSDDGFDVINQEFPVIIENSYAMGNGYSDYGTKLPPSGNGYGFKMGESKTGKGHHLIQFCAAWKNRASGFYANYTSAGSRWYNNTSYQNGERSFNMASKTYDENGKATSSVAPLTGDNAHVLKNNIAYPNKLSQIGECWLKTTTEDKYVECQAGEYNTWNLKLDLTDDDFLSLTDPSMTITGKDLSTIAGILGPRRADGSLPDVDFLKLSKTSRAIDKGEDINLPYVGGAPDLGAFEYGMVRPAVESSSSMVETSSSSATSNSEGVESSASSESSASTAIVAMGLDFTQTHRERAKVFDMQGRYLGTLSAESIRNKSVTQALQNKFKAPGAYLVQWGRSQQIFSVK